MIGIRPPAIVLMALLSLTSARKALPLSASNQMEYALSQENREILENWFDVEHQWGDFTAGLRFEIYQPHEKELVQEGIPFRYLSFQREGIDVRVGDFYALFGRGLTLRTYEDRDIRVDNHLDGVKIEAQLETVNVTLLSGRLRGMNDTKEDLLHGVDVALNSFFGISLGASHLNNSGQGIDRTEISSGRAEVFLGPLSLYGEYGELPPGGSGLYLASSLSTTGFGLSAEYKDYDQFAFRTVKTRNIQDDLIDYNAPPSLSREHTYTLLNRNSHVLNAVDEQGFQIEGTWSPRLGTSVLLNFSQTDDHRDSLLFREVYAQVEHEICPSLSGIVGLNRAEETDVEKISPIADLTWYLNATNSFRIELQHQHTKGDRIGEYDDQYLVVEYNRSPHLTITLGGERTNKSAFQEELSFPEDDLWAFGQIDCHIRGNHDLTLWYGSRRGGLICVGGRCRYEPTFEGIEVKLLSNF